MARLCKHQNSFPSAFLRLDNSLAFFVVFQSLDEKRTWKFFIEMPSICDRLFTPHQQALISCWRKEGSTKYKWRHEKILTSLLSKILYFIFCGILILFQYENGLHAIMKFVAEDKWYQNVKSFIFSKWEID